ncbi:SYP5 protein [Gonium pectorale]|uniref:SYP5 protein n=1 Tax=Gonium pectorale TaxID=33097 RepID=A0A150FWN7_GONPE|nr:SYP5 protein [Gonium pectorale]|eukprot:KXZ42016.1 SYP5 protein [Gonium pectorale]
MPAREPQEDARRSGVERYRGDATGCIGGSVPEDGRKGFRLDIDGWTKEFEEAKQLAQARAGPKGPKETLQLIQERNSRHAGGGPEASRLSAAARKKLGTLGVQLDRLLRWLDSSDADSLSESEKNRRRDQIYDLRNRREQMQLSIKRSHGQADRDALFGGAASSSGPLPPRETEATAPLDNRGLLQLQRDVMRRQDEELEAMEKTHIALAIGEEVDLQTRLLDDLADDVDVSHSRLRAATQRVKQVLKQSSNWRLGTCVFLLIVTLVVVIILTVKLSRLL